MSLEEILSTLKTSNVLCIITDLEGDELAKVYASSYDALDDALVSRGVKSWSITSASQIAIVLKDETSA